MSTIQSSALVSSSVFAKETPSLVAETVVKASEVNEDSASVSEYETRFELSSASLTRAKTYEEYFEESRAEDVKYHYEPRKVSQDTLAVVDEHLKVIQKFVNLVKPELAQSGWDFTLKNGSLEVQGGNLSEKDRQWLENVLNLDETLVSAVKGFYGSVVKFYEHNDEREHGGFAKGNDLIFYHDVAKQLDGNLRIKDVMKSRMDDIVAKWEALPPSEKIFPKPSTTHPYSEAMENAQRYLKG